MIVQLAVDSYFGGTDPIKTKYDSIVYYPVLAFYVPDEPSERVRKLITHDKDGNQRIFANIGTQNRERTVALIEDFIAYADELDFDIDPPREGKKVGKIKNYPGKPGEGGFELPEGFERRTPAAPTSATTNLSSDAPPPWESEWSASEGVTVSAPSVSSTAGPDAGVPSGEGVDSGEVPPTADAEPPSPGPTLSEDDWSRALAVFGSKGSFLIAYRKFYDRSPGKGDGITVDELDVLIEAQ